MHPSQSKRAAIVLPVLIIAVGAGWLLTTLGLVPAVNWAWVLALGGMGIVILMVGGIDRVTVIVGPFFIVTSVLSILRQTGRLEFETEVPILVTLVGVLMLISRLSNLPDPPPTRRDDAGGD